MRTIKFRGKRVDNDEWCEGDLMRKNSYRYGDKETNYFIGTLLGYDHVDPFTVGQFTGLTDKNGKEIFEGDKVSYYQPYAKKIEDGFVKWDDIWACFGIYTKIWYEYCHESDWVKIQEIEVIGNIHDKN